MTLKQHFLCTFPYGLTWLLGYVLLFHSSLFCNLTEYQRGLCMIPVMVVASVIYAIFAEGCGCHTNPTSKNDKNISTPQGNTPTKKNISQNSEEK